MKPTSRQSSSTHLGVGGIYVQSMGCMLQGCQTQWDDVGRWCMQLHLISSDNFFCLGSAMGWAPLNIWYPGQCTPLPSLSYATDLSIGINTVYPDSGSPGFRDGIFYQPPLSCQCRHWNWHPCLLVISEKRKPSQKCPGKIQISLSFFESRIVLFRKAVFETK